MNHRCSTSAELLIKTSMWEIQRLIMKNSNLIVKIFHMDMQLLGLSGNQNCVARNQATNHFPVFLWKWFKNSTDTLINEGQRLSFAAGWFVLQEKSDNSQLLAIAVHIFGNAITFFREFYNWTTFCRYEVVDWDHDSGNRESCFGKERVCLSRRLIKKALHHNLLVSGDVRSEEPTK